MPDALADAARSLLQPRILRLVWMPLLGALMLWMVIGAYFWSGLVTWLHGFIALNRAAEWIGIDPSGQVSQWVATLAMLLLLMPLTHATALLVTATFAMPLMTAEVAARDYPQMAAAGAFSFAASLRGALATTLLYLVLWVLTLPLWLLALPAFVLPLLLNGWYNNRLFRFDALTAHATTAEYDVLSARFRSAWFGLGLCAALLQMVPLLNLVSPVYSGLTFIHFGFARLQDLRASGRVIGPLD